MQIVFVGAGRLATNLAVALHAKGHGIVQVYSRTMASAQQLSEKVGALPTTSIDALSHDADAYIVAVKDAALSALVPALVKGRHDACFFHTSGSMPMTVFQGNACNYGVVYPMQTFSKERLVDFSNIPIFIEASNEATLEVARGIAASVSCKVSQLPGEQRRQLHLAAVFACNFVNHCYALSADILRRNGLPFNVMLPLVQETARKVEEMEPKDAQTGPAIRFDQNVIDAHLALLQDMPMAHDIYELMSKSINQLSKQP